MKQLLASLLATVASLSIWAQTVTLQFEGTTKNRNYQVVIDGTTYSSADAVRSGKNKMLTMNNLSSGSHTLAVYPAGESVASGNLLYSNSFQLREGYDMDIVVKADGAVSFTEKANTHTAVSSGAYNAAVGMNSTEFNRLAQSVRGKLLQGARVNTVREAFTTTSNRFTTEQIARLLSYINSEPTRLDLAKGAYARVVDPANYKNLADLFSSETLRTELDFFLRNTTINPAGTTPMAPDSSSAPQQEPVASARSTSEAEGASLAESKAVTTTSTPRANKETVRSESKTESEKEPAGNYNVHKPVSDRTFNQLTRRMRNQRAQGGKIALLTNALEEGDQYYTTAQLQQLITPITAESDRLKLVKLAYPRTADTANIKQLYSLLSDRYSQMELDHFVRFGPAGTKVAPVTSAYASRVAIDDVNYSHLDLKMHFQLRQPSLVAEIKKAFSGKNYFTAEQIQEWLKLVTAEEERLSLAKLAYLRITDPTTFTPVYDLFSNKEHREQLERYVAENRF